VTEGANKKIKYPLKKIENFKIKTRSYKTGV